MVLSCNFIRKRGFGLQAEVLFFRAFGSMNGGLETATTPGRKVSFLHDLAQPVGALSCNFIGERSFGLQACGLQGTGRY